MKRIARVALVLLAASQNAHAGSDPYLTVAVGDSRERIISLFGPPANPERDLPRRRKEQIASTLNKLDNNGAESYSIWKREGEMVYVIGFNKHGKVAFKHRFFFVKGT